MKFLIVSLLLISILVGCGNTGTTNARIIPIAVEPGTQVIAEPTVEFTIIPTKTPISTVALIPPPTPTSTPIPTPTLSPPTPTPISILTPPTPTLSPTLSPTPTPIGPQEGQLTPDGQMIYRNGVWQLLVPLTPTPTVPISTPTPTIIPTPTRTPIPDVVPQYGAVTSSQIVGTPDKLDFSSGPTVASSKLSFTSTYTSRGLGAPTVVQLWQRNGSADGLVSDANNDDCFTQKPIAFYRIAPARGMKYDKNIESNYLWSYCINQYRFNPQSLSIPWVNATSWSYDTQGVLETFTFEGSTTGLFDAFSPAGKWVVVIFAGSTILSEQIIP